MARSGRTITIRIISDSSGSTTPSSTPGASTSTSPSASGSKSTKGMAARAAAFYLTTNAISTLRTLSDMGYSRYIDLTEDYMAQMGAQNMQAHLSRIGTLSGSTISGAMVGAKFGPIGAIIGSIVGFGMGGFRNELSVRRTIAEQERALHEEAYSLYFNTLRAGAVNYSRGTEN